MEQPPLKTMTAQDDAGDNYLNRPCEDEEDDLLNSDKGTTRIITAIIEPNDQITAAPNNKLSDQRKRQTEGTWGAASTINPVM